MAYQKDSVVDEIQTLGQVLEASSEFPSSCGLYLPVDEEWTAETRCVLATTESSKKEALPKNFGFALAMHQVQDVVLNLRLQAKDRASPEQLVESFLYYFDHDAFLCL